MWIRSWVLLLCGSVICAAQSPLASLVTELKAKRQALPGAHQEFDVSRTTKTDTSTQTFKQQVTIDISGEKWSERTRTSAADRTRFFDGKDVFLMEAGSKDFVRAKRPNKDQEDPAPAPYQLRDPDWSKAKEIERGRCGAEKHPCIVIEVPLKKWLRPRMNFQELMRLVDGVEKITFDLDTGLVVFADVSQVIDNGRRVYGTDSFYAAKRTDSVSAVPVELLQLPGGGKEVKEFPKWNVARIRKELVGKPAPDISVNDIHGVAVSLADLKGKTVLLDFWATWCPPCRADMPSLEKLNKKYGGKELTIIGISVDEERGIVEKFLGEHPHSYPVVLTSENEIPRQYETREIPTYVVIDATGNVQAAVVGDKGFSELRTLLKKAGLDID
jgi:thiol-disulfide isomerase/thioredoxin